MDPLDHSSLYKSRSYNNPKPLNYRQRRCHFTVVNAKSSVTLNYIERFVELVFQRRLQILLGSRCRDRLQRCPCWTFSGAQTLGGQVVTGLADGVVSISQCPPVHFVFGGGGTAGLTGIAMLRIVTVGRILPAPNRNPPLDLGSPLFRANVKKVSAVTLRFAMPWPN